MRDVALEKHMGCAVDSDQRQEEATQATVTENLHGFNLDFSGRSGYNDHMMSDQPIVPSRTTVGSRELKTRLGTYLRYVRSGTTIIVTDRGRPVAELRPLTGSEGDVEARLQELVLTGMLSAEVAERPPLAPFEPIRISGKPLSETIREDREDRF